MDKDEQNKIRKGLSTIDTRFYGEISIQRLFYTNNMASASADELGCVRLSSSRFYKNPPESGQDPGWSDFTCKTSTPMPKSGLASRLGGCCDGHGLR